MKKLLPAAMSAVMALTATALCVPFNAAADNPMIQTIFSTDPAPMVYDDTLYVYTGRDKPNSDFYYMPDWHCYSTTDMQNWTDHGMILSWDSFTWGKEDSAWASQCIERNGKFYYYVTLENKSGGGRGIGVAVADSPTGPFKDAIGKPLCGPNWDYIDPTVFIDDDGQAYYFWGQFSGKGAKMNPDMKTLDWSTYRDGIVTEAEHGFHEGSYVVKRGEFYYYIYADISRNHRPTCIGYSMSKSPLGPYEYKGVIIDNAGCDPEVWNNHGSIVEFEGRWYVLYHRSTHASVTMRKACIEPITFNEDGTINEVVMTSQGAAGPLDAFRKLDAARACMLSGNVRVALDEGSTDREVLAAFGDRDSAEWRYLDFGRGAKRIFLNIKSPGGGRVSVYADDTLVGELELPACPDWITLRTRIRKTRGVHAVRLVYESEGQEGVAAPALDWLRFSRRRWGRR